MDGSAYLYEGISKGAQAFAEGVQQYHQNRQKSQFLDAQLDDMMRWAPEYGVKIDPEEMIKYSKGNMGAKEAIVTNLAMQLNLAHKKKQLESMIEYRDTQNDLRAMRDEAMARHRDEQNRIAREKLDSLDRWRGASLDLRSQEGEDKRTQFELRYGLDERKFEADREYKDRSLDIREEMMRDLKQYRDSRIEIDKSKMTQDLIKFDLQHDVQLQKIGLSKERLELDRKKVEKGDMEPVERTYRRAAEVAAKGEYELADLLTLRAKTMANAGKLMSVQPTKGGKVLTKQGYKAEWIPKLKVRPENKKKTPAELDAMVEEIWNLSMAGSPDPVAPAAAPDASTPVAPNSTNTAPTRPILRFIPNSRTLQQ